MSSHYLVFSFELHYCFFAERLVTITKINTLVFTGWTIIMPSDTRSIDCAANKFRCDVELLGGVYEF